MAVVLVGVKTDVIVERACRHVRELLSSVSGCVLEGIVSDMTESVPLCSTLRVHVVDVVVGDVLGQRLDLMFEGLAAERWCLGNIERKTGDSKVSNCISTNYDQGSTDFTGTISPVLISFPAAATREGVRRFRRPIFEP